MIKKIMITGSEAGPNVNDDWVTSIPLDATKDYTSEELVELVETQHPYYCDHAMWYYVGEEYEDKANVLGKNMQLVNGAVRYGYLFNPWDTDNFVLIQKSGMVEQSDNYDYSWRKEIAMEAGMLHGTNAYNDVMGF
tara:strand:- start:38 stop:445 length:408 start_codon:yes stop_codon:yes gene_type:complete